MIIICKNKLVQFSAASYKMFHGYIMNGCQVVMFADVCAPINNLPQDRGMGNPREFDFSILPG